MCSVMARWRLHRSTVRYLPSLSHVPSVSQEPSPLPDESVHESASTNNMVKRNGREDDSAARRNPAKIFNFFISFYHFIKDCDIVEKHNRRS